MIPPIDPETQAEIDRPQVFLLYATFCGDVEKTAHAVGLRPIDILRVADEEKWNDKLKAILELKKSNRPGDIERAINRALNYVQANRMRLLVERVLHKLSMMTGHDLEKYIFTEHEPKTGLPFSKLTTRALADLASALEKAQAMTYLALGDTTQDRNRRKEDDAGEHSGSQMHEQIAAAMGAVAASSSPRAQLLDAQLKVSHDTVAEARPPVHEHPADNDDH